MTCKNSKVDFFEEFYKRGLHTVLEKITLVLPLPALTQCIKVNKRWEDIVRFYNDFLKLENLSDSEFWSRVAPKDFLV
jgi:hypothetical protein